MSGYVIMLGCPDEWSEAQVQILADRLIGELPLNVPVYYAHKDDVEVPATTVVVRA